METVLYILLLILFLSILIVIHELGHLSAAKFFKVYCHDFSIGFGPAFFHKRRKGGETYFSLRVIPFGGFVSMYGEGAEELDEFKDVDPSRSLVAIKKWKQAIILAAGVFMNVILAIVLLFISEQACVHYKFVVNYARVNENSIAAKSGFDPAKAIYMRVALDKELNSTNYVYIDKLATFDTDTEKTYFVCLDQSKITKDNLTYSSMLTVFGSQKITIQYKDEAGKTVTEDMLIPDYKEVNLAERKVLHMSLYNCEYDIIGNSLSAKEDTKVAHPIDLTISEGKLPELGISFYMDTYWNNYQKHVDQNGFVDDRNALRKTFVDFGNGAVAIFKGLGSLFTKEGWNNVGGIVAIGVSTSQTLKNFGIAQFLYYWGVISVNLAIVNLIPFPGLDGWHLVVLAIESISRKKVPQKVKGIMSAIGIALLFALMIAIIVKDIIRYI